MLVTVDARAAQAEAFLHDVLGGLALTRKSLPSRWLYDQRGSELFEEITQLDEYYPTRTEAGILSANASNVAAFSGARAVIIEYGAGAAVKTGIVLDALDEPQAYVPVDIAGDFVAASAERLAGRHPALGIRPVNADFDLPSDLPPGTRMVRKRGVDRRGREVRRVRPRRPAMNRNSPATNTTRRST